MEISYYGYNAFLVQSGDKRLAIDPGALFFYWFRFTTLFPRPVWPSVTHIFVTHGDPDHYWYADKMAQVASAPVILNRSMLRERSGKTLALGPRSKGLAFNAEFDKVHALAVDETLEIDGMRVRGVKATHGPLVLKVGPLNTTVRPGPQERIGWGAIGFDITVDGKRIVNLGDTLLHAREWEALREPDVLMIPIGGKVSKNTMDEDEALQAVSVIAPKLVIPCHYNCPGLFSKQLNPADVSLFEAGVTALGAQCAVMAAGETFQVG
jgi:L-ascorbate metabolism protein UlaG (beta-lactamase superfamily)